MPALIRPPHNTAREEIDDRGYIEPAFRCPDIRAAVKHVGSDGGRLPLT